MSGHDKLERGIEGYDFVRPSGLVEEGEQFHGFCWSRYYGCALVDLSSNMINLHFSPLKYHSTSPCRYYCYSRMKTLV